MGYEDESIAPQPDEPFFLISIYDTWLEFPRAMEFLGYDSEGLTGTQLTQSIDTATYFVQPGDS